MSRAFNELIKEFNLIRSYSRDFYINGFKPREEFQEKSLRSYDNERRRIESYLNNYIEWEQTPQGKTLRLNLKDESLATNPFFKLWKTKTFTKKDIFLHFILLDCLTSYDSLSLAELTDCVHDQYLSQFEQAPTFSEITIRNKLKEYCQLGIFQSIEKEKRIHYQLTPIVALDEKWLPVLHFYKEILPGGVIGQYLLDQSEYSTESPFTFKHHFIVHSLDEEITLSSLTAIKEQRYMHIVQYNDIQIKIAPFSFYHSTETGRQYLVGFIRKKILTSIRIDNIKTATLGKMVENHQELSQIFSERKNTSWNGSYNQEPMKKLRVQLQIEAGKEDYLMTRIAREQRMGTSYRLDSNTVIFEIELLDLFALNPFLRTFIGRILSIESTDKNWERLFINDMNELIALYAKPQEEEKK